MDLVQIADAELDAIAALFLEFSSCEMGQMQPLAQR
jgi:hypothetical protein